MPTFPLFNSKSCDHTKDQRGKITSQHMLCNIGKRQTFRIVKKWKLSQTVVVLAVISSELDLCACTAKGSTSLSNSHLRSENRETRESVPLSPVGVGSDLQHGGPLSIEHLCRVGQVKEVKLHVDWRRRILPGLKGICAIPQYHFLQSREGGTERGQRALGHPKGNSEKK